MAKSKARLLILEDDEILRASLQALLEAEGYRVALAANGEEGMTALARDPLPDLIVLDLHMPRKDGFEFRQEMRNTPQFADIPILYCSASPEIQGKVRWIGVERFLAKPFDIAELLGAIRSLLEARAARKSS